jgi:hypothetical protein
VCQSLVSFAVLACEIRTVPSDLALIDPKSDRANRHQNAREFGRMIGRCPQSRARCDSTPNLPLPYRERFSTAQRRLRRFARVSWNPKPVDRNCQRSLVIVRSAGVPCRAQPALSKICSVVHLHVSESSPAEGTESKEIPPRKPTSPAHFQE